MGSSSHGGGGGGGLVKHQVRLKWGFQDLFLVSWVFSLKIIRWGDSNGYTQHNFQDKVIFLKYP